MISFAWYGLQVIACSAVMMGYYWLVLRNKRFHRYNRFYILVSVILSFLIPIVKIQLDNLEARNRAIQIMYVFAGYNSSIDAVVAAKSHPVNWMQLAGIGYLVVSLFFLVLMIRALVKIYQLFKKYPGKKFQDVWLIYTNASGTPFSFFRYIFWNEDINLDTATGQQVLQHELIHVKEKHSTDTMIMQVVLAIGWCNPFFWLARKELHMIHEFIADQQSVEAGDTASFAAMLLAAAYPRQQYLLTHPFFFSPIKRRLLMLTNLKNPRFSYVRRVMILPLMAIVALLFAFRMKQDNESSSKLITGEQTVYSDSTVIPAGTGVSQADLDEYEAILKKVTSRVLPSKRVVTTFSGNFQESKKAYEIYCGMNAEQRDHATKVTFTKVPAARWKIPSTAQYEKWKNASEYGIWINEKHVVNTALDKYKSSDFAMYYASKLTGAAKTGKLYNVQVNLYTVGYVTSKIQKDTMILITANPVKVVSIDSVPKLSLHESNSEKELVAPLFFLDGKKITKEEMSQLNPNNIASMNVLKDKAALDKYGAEGKNGVIEITAKSSKELNIVDGKTTVNSLKEIDPASKERNNLLKGEQVTKNKEAGKDGGATVTLTKLAKPLYVVDGKQMPAEFNFSSIPPSDIIDVNVWKEDQAVAKYGEAGKNGVVEISTKVFTIGSDYKVSAVTHVSASFPGGAAAWHKYLERNLNRDLPVENGAPPGHYIVNMNFIVDQSGHISSLVAENDPGYGTCYEALRVIQKGPDWVPAEQNGKKVTSLVKQSITFVISAE